MKEELSARLRSLPQPKNDYEIVVPEDELGVEEQQDSSVSSSMEDQSDIDARNLSLLAAQSEY